MNRAENVKVFCRIRPRLGQERLVADEWLHIVNGTTVEVPRSKLQNCEILKEQHASRLATSTAASDTAVPGGAAVACGSVQSAAPTFGGSGGTSSASGSCSAASSDEKYLFKYDGVLGPEKTQADVWALLKMDHILTQLLEGYHGTILAYGQTG
eukprot:g4950.t1